MRTLVQEYSDLHCALDDVRSRLGTWAEAPSVRKNGALTPVRHAQLVLQEWIANLQQHADFGDREPLLQTCVAIEDGHVYGAVIDNSEGFPLDRHLPPHADALDDLPERRMGLRMIEACTNVLAYTSTHEGLYCFEFSIPADHDPCLSIPF